MENLSDEEWDSLFDSVLQEESLYEKCPELRKINLNEKYIVIKGHVQSGKTNFIICASALFISMGYSVVHLLRDRTSDREQLYDRLINFDKELHIVKNAGTIGSKKVPQIYLALSNKSSLSKVFKIINKSTFPYILFIDEVDYVDSGEFENVKKYEVIHDMKKNAYCTFGVSATIMDQLGKEDISSKNIILLNTKSSYKGIDAIQLLEIYKKCKYTGTFNDNLFDQDIGLLSFINDFSKRKPTPYLIEIYPNICLVNICRTKGPCFKIQEYLGNSHPELATIVYNGDGISFRQGEFEFKEKITISKCLQRLKDDGGVDKYPNIMIFAGDLAGRCVSFVSEDYKWHLTDQRLLISSSCDEPELIQKIRLCGVYNDDLPLKLYATKKTIDELRKAYLRQEEIVSSLQDKEIENVRSFIDSMEMHKEKFTRRSMVKDHKIDFKITKVNYETGWDYDICIPESKQKSNLDLDTEIIIKIINNSMLGKPTKMSTFLSQLSPNKFYKKEELYNFLREAGYQQPQSILSSYLLRKISGFGFNHKLFNLKDGIYKIRDDVAICWNN